MTSENASIATPHPQQLSVAYLGIILIWSTTPLAIQWSAQGTNYALAVLARMSIGLLLSALCVLLIRIPVPCHRRALQSYLLGGCSLFCAMALTYWGAQYLPSGLISVLYGLSPLATSLFARFWLPRQHLQLRQIAGLSLALGGLCMIFLTGERVAEGRHLAGLLAVLGAVLIQAANLVGLKRLADDSPPMASTLGSLLTAFPLFALLAWTFPHSEINTPDLRACLATAYLGIFGSVVGFALYYYAIRHMAPVRIALITLITPVVALCFGHWLNGEIIGTEVMLGSACILSGLLLHQFPLPQRKHALRSA